MSAQHSPTPWKGDDFESAVVMDRDGRDILLVAGPESTPYEVDVSNSKRIIECVNGCEELPDPSKVGELIAEMQRRLKDDATIPMHRFVAQEVLDALGVSS